jgi:hypothetical protein
MDVLEDPAIWDELVDFGKEHPTVGPSRRLLGGGFDLTAEENQVYLFMVRRRTLHEPNLPSRNPTLRDIHDVFRPLNPHPSTTHLTTRLSSGRYFSPRPRSSSASKS